MQKDKTEKTRTAAEEKPADLEEKTQAAHGPGQDAVALWRNEGDEDRSVPASDEPPKTNGKAERALMDSIEPEAEGEPEAEAKEEAEAEGEAGTEAKAEAREESGPEAEAEADGEPEAEAQEETEAEGEAGAEAREEAGPEAEAEADGEPEAEAQQETEAEAEGEAGTEAKAEAREESGPEAEAKEETEAEGEAGAEAKAEAKAEPGPEAEVKPKPSPGRKWILTFLAAALTGIACVGGYWFYEKSQVYSVCRAEAGIEVTAADFLKTADEGAYFTKESDSIDITKPGEYHLVIQKGNFGFAVTLYIEDTIPPEVEVKPLTLDYGQTCGPVDFIGEIRDATETAVVFQEEPDFSASGKQLVKLQVTDAGNNVTVAEAELMISRVVTELELEVGGGEPDISAFVLAGEGGKILTDLEQIDFMALGSHTVRIELAGTVYPVNMDIVDTVAPVFTTKTIEGHLYCKRSADEFVEEAEDLTELTYSFEENPDLETIGNQKVVIVAKDQGGNEAKQEAGLVLSEDTEAPVIAGAVDKSVFLGESVSYKTGITIEDACPEAHQFQVDATAVNINETGTYPVTYTATDCAGNSSEVTVNLTVRERIYDINEVNAMADEVLGRILSPEMSQRDKARAIYDYVKRRISYGGYSEKGNYVRAAYEALAYGHGDCYAYASASKVLLTRAGITNMDIERIPSGQTMHWWNLVDIGDGHGWYHFDTTPRINGPDFFLWTDQQITEYSNSNNHSHNYDRSLYPAIN